MSCLPYATLTYEICRELAYLMPLLPTQVNGRAEKNISHPNGLAINKNSCGGWDCERRQKNKGKSGRSLVRWAGKRQRESERLQ